MVNNQLLEYIETELKGGASRDAIVESLKNVGWIDVDIDEAFRLLGTPISPRSSLLSATDYHDAEAAPFQASPIGSITPEEINRAVAAHMQSTTVPAENLTAAPSQVASVSPTVREPVQVATIVSVSQTASSTTDDTHQSTDTVHQGHPLIIAGAILISLLLVAGSFFGYMFWWKAEIAPSGGSIGGLIVRNFSQVKSFVYDGTLSFSWSYDNKKISQALMLPPWIVSEADPARSNEKTERSLIVSIAGAEDWSNAAERRSLMNVSVDVKGGENPVVAFAFAVEGRGVGEIAYVKLSDMPFLDLFGLSSIENQWLLIDPRVLLKDFEEPIKERYQEDFNVNQYQQKEILKNISSVMGSRNIIHFKNNPETGGFNDMAVYKYRFALDVNELVQVFIALEEMSTGRRIEVEEKKTILKISDYLHFDEGELWVGQKDLLPYFVSMNASIIDQKTKAFTGTATFKATLKDYDKQVEILVPSNVKPVDEMIHEIMSASMVVEKNESKRISF